MSNNIFSDYINYSRRIADIINIGDIPMGGENPIRIQSMTNTPTLDTLATVEQCKRVFDAGADYVRITTPAIRDAENLIQIKKELQAAGYKKPLVADVHFNPAVAEAAARIVEKVRINPGNYTDKKNFKTIEFTEEEYKLELERIHERVVPLLKICKEYGTAIRIGVNHGSLSDRIMSRYGDTPEGMVESAMEFLRIFKSEGFKQTVISMKSSNTRVMTYSTRMLVSRMVSEGMNYPVHLGVTEAGEGEDGIIKSALGISALLSDGIGETIRVSLTGDPEQEIPVAREIVDHFNALEGYRMNVFNQPQISLFDFNRRKTNATNDLGGTLTPKVVISRKPGDESMVDLRPGDSFYFSGNKTNTFTFNTISTISPQCQIDAPRVLVIKSHLKNATGEVRSVIAGLQEQDCQQPLVIRRKYDTDNLRKFQISAACDFGAILTDGFVDGIWLENENISAPDIYQLSLNMLQASRLRMSKTEYISCPSCGRTLFDLTATTAKIKERTSHLKHLKIGIMGCIVNGPGEMADADYGYVGTGPKKITLYKGKEVIKKNIPESKAVDELIALIKNNGDWVEE